MIWSILLGITAGARTMTAIAVICWAAYFGWLPVHGTWAFWTAYLVSPIVFSVLALGEYIGDTLPNTPSRTAPMLLLGRMAFGILDCVIVATALHEPKAGGVVFGLVGALIGAFGGLRLRLWLGRLFGRDLPAALLESAAALLFALIAVHAIHKGMLHEKANAPLHETGGVTLSRCEPQAPFLEKLA